MSFDNGPSGSIAEDGYFAIKAYQLGYRFGFIEGDMCEKSPFTFIDYIRQRKRWLQGLVFVVAAPEFGWRYKICLAASIGCWLTIPLTTLSVFLTFFYGLDCPLILNVIFNFIGSVNFYMFFYGTVRSFTVQDLGFFYFLFYLSSVIIIIPLSLILENIVVCSSLCNWKLKFPIVKKS